MTDMLSPNRMIEGGAVGAAGEFRLGILAELEMRSRPDYGVLESVELGAPLESTSRAVAK